jgi:hypothetical protein
MFSKTILKKHLCFILGLLLLMTGCAATPLITAARSNDIKKMENLLNNGVDVNERSGGANALNYAVWANSIEAVHYLLDKGADVNIGMCNGWTPILLAVDNNNASMVKLLLDNGADVTVSKKLGTPRGMAEEKGYSVIARMLREAEGKEYEELYAKESDQKSEKIPRIETSKRQIRR